MSSKEDLLRTLSVKKLRALAHENKVLLVRENPWSFSDNKIPAKNKDEIIEILNNSRKVSKKKVEAKVFGSKKEPSKRKSTSSTKPKRRRLSKAEKTLILKSQNFKCANCKKDISKISPDYDHRIPLGIGGSDTITNIQALCGTCHREKYARDRLEISRAKK